jgi:hypothetical protein
VGSKPADDVNPPANLDRIVLGEHQHAILQALCRVSHDAQTWREQDPAGHPSGSMDVSTFRCTVHSASPRIRAISPRRLHRDQPTQPSRRVVKFYNRRGTAEQWIKIL